MAVGTYPKFSNFKVSLSQTPSSLIVAEASCCSPRETPLHSGHIILKQKRTSSHPFGESLIALLRQSEFLLKHSVLIEPYSNTDFGVMRNSDMNDSLDSVYLERTLLDYTNHEFDRPMLMEENMLSTEDESLEKPKTRFNSPMDGISGRSSKSPNSIEDLNKEIERLFLNSEKFGLTSFIWNADEIAEGRRAPVADILHCCKGFRTNRRKKRRVATALSVRNQNESDSSNGISSPDENSGCEEYSESSTLVVADVHPPIVVPVPGKSGLDRFDQAQSLNVSSPFSINKLQLSEDSAFAPIRSIPRSQSTPPQNMIDM